jgi:hypothetical protein
MNVTGRASSRHAPLPKTHIAAGLADSLDHWADDVKHVLALSTIPISALSTKLASMMVVPSLPWSFWTA